ncbi:MAG: hypothetical protein M3498_10940 [Deinococcota bacterium]|nr:hypothetical protein [Deinococcota bacterium]
MQLVALFCHDPQLRSLLQDLHRREPALSDLLLHPVSEGVSSDSVFAALRPLNFAGALVLDDVTQREAFAAAARTSLDAQEVGAADALAVTPFGLVGEYTFGRAAGRALRRAGWDGRGASAVVLGSGVRARALSRELATLGVRQLAVLSSSRPLAEETTRLLAATTRIVAKAQDDSLTRSLIESADLLVRADNAGDIRSALLGPHLTVVDLEGGAMSALRRQATEVGALSLSLRDVQAEQLALALGHLLEARLETGLFLELFHNL